MSVYWAERTLDGAGVRIAVDGDRVTAVTVGVPPAAGDVRLPGLTLPGMVNAHSHAFHRALRGRTSTSAGSFWTWRKAMYGVAAGLDPDRYLALARATYAEMALAGITTVGEFHYLHHDPAGRPYRDGNEMGRALQQAATEAGIRLTLLDTIYLQSGIDGRPPEGPQVRFSDGDVEAWTARVAGLDDAPAVRIGAAVHSVRAVPEPAIAQVAAWATDLDRPLHVHVSEQPRENEECVAATGHTPAALLAGAGALGPATTAVHATHLSDGDIELLGRSGTTICMCPTTERDLADGIGPADRLVTAGSTLSLGTDSHAVIDLFEEARAVELDLRLARGQRGHLPAGALLDATAAAGSLGWDGGRIEPGRLADLTTIALDGPRLAGVPADASVVFAATASDVTHVVVGGRLIVEDGRHLMVDDVGGQLRAAIDAAWA